MKLLTIIGARPQIIKAAALSRAISNHFASVVEEHILHTGQHYDENMSAIFFNELGIPHPQYNLGVGSGLHGEQTAKMIGGIEQTLMSDHYDGLVIYGDTNSTLAGAVAASKLHIPVFHIEAGLRSYNMSMPEEGNRIVADHLASICFAPTQTAVENLRKEGLTDSAALFADGHKRLVVNSGDVMYDNSLYFAAIAEKQSTILQQHNLQDNGYILATIHRDYNTDSPQRLTNILKALADIHSQSHQPVVLPLHPRTRAKLRQLPQLETLLDSFTIIPPAGFLDITLLERHANIVMTDSGGVQKEAFFFEKPCVILRSETEWVEIINHGAGIVADADYDKICQAHLSLAGKSVHFPQLFGDGHAAEQIVQNILNYLR